MVVLEHAPNQHITSYIVSMRKEHEENESLGVDANHSVRSCNQCEAEAPSQRYFCCECFDAVCSKCLQETNTCPSCEQSLLKLFEPASNVCLICLCQAPIYVDVFTACGHTACSPCVEQIELDAHDNSILSLCPFCRQHSSSMTIVNNIIV